MHTNLFETLFSILYTRAGCLEIAMDTRIKWDFINGLFLNTHYE